ncbi:TRAP transporter small permease subunit [Roseibaca sp. Y0-43]|jgi:TRAP-type mannitol/chloroaromatic compound transport system permease small subunit|uniref:TRAP transporter small permease subunit n=1 Tax=Roseibaca sp. Y0-43 TaxID=2816854 RepID=UPI001D0C9011|nr:TRAP transporter small permease subunit [Roseibaca sp. Y0-43]MCC1482789.1 TRAP transporter small permease subunit [Roseibaca sp. Y0-43]
MNTSTRHFIGGVSAVLGYFAALILVPLILASVYEVISRYVFNQPTIWAYEIGYMAMGASFLLGSAYTLRDGQHVRIDVLATHFSPRLKATLDLTGYLLLFLPIGIWLTFALYHYTVEAYEWGERSGESAWNPVVWPYHLVFFTAFAAMVLQVIAEMLGCLQTLFTSGTGED